MTIIGSKGSVADIYIPASTYSWNLKGLVSKGEFNNLVLIGFQFGASETVDIRRCFNDVTHIFSFGRDIGNSMVSVSLMCFLGGSCKKSGNGSGYSTVNRLIQKYDKNGRIYMSKKSIEIAIDNFLIYGYLVGMQIGGVDPSTGTCVVTFQFILDGGV